MKHNCIHKHIAASLALASGLAFTVAADTIGTAITYQGLLSSGGTPANGNYFLRFKVYDAFAGGTQCGTTFSVEPQWITNGLFTVPVDLGQIYDGAARYLEIAVAVPPLPLHPTA
jgi:hypothetical protein